MGEDLVMKRVDPIPSSEITPLSVYLNRRNFLNGGLAVASLLTTGYAYRRLNRTGSAKVETPVLEGLARSPKGGSGLETGFWVDEPMTSLEQGYHPLQQLLRVLDRQEGVAGARPGS